MFVGILYVSEMRNKAIQIAFCMVIWEKLYICTDTTRIKAKANCNDYILPTLEYSTKRRREYVEIRWKIEIGLNKPSNCGTA